MYGNARLKLVLWPWSNPVMNYTHIHIYKWQNFFYSVCPFRNISSSCYLQYSQYRPQHTGTGAVYNSNFILLLMFAFPKSNCFLDSHYNSPLFLLLFLWRLKCCGRFSHSGARSPTGPPPTSVVHLSLFALILRYLVKIQLHCELQLFLEMINTLLLTCHI